MIYAQIWFVSSQLSIFSVARFGFNTKLMSKYLLYALSHIVVKLKANMKRIEFTIVIRERRGLLNFRLSYKLPTFHLEPYRLSKGNIALGKIKSMVILGRRVAT